jgi:hypothetical protein
MLNNCKLFQDYLKKDRLHLTQKEHEPQMNSEYLKQEAERLANLKRYVDDEINEAIAMKQEAMRTLQEAQDLMKKANTVQLSAEEMKEELEKIRSKHVQQESVSVQTDEIMIEQLDVPSDSSSDINLYSDTEEQFDVVKEPLRKKKQSKKLNVKKQLEKNSQTGSKSKPFICNECRKFVVNTVVLV